MSKNCDPPFPHIAQTHGKEVFFIYYPPNTPLSQIKKGWSSLLLQVGSIVFRCKESDGENDDDDDAVRGGLVSTSPNFVTDKNS